METTVRATRTTREALRRLPTSARPIIDAADILAPVGYEVEPVLAGLSFPTAIEVAPDGTLFVCEGGSTWPTRPVMPTRILSLDPSGRLEVIASEVPDGGPRGLAWHDGALYVSVKGGYRTRFLRYDLSTRERALLPIALPNGGWHEPVGPLFGPHDGLLYVAQGSVSLNGVPDPEGFTVDLLKHPDAHDVPGQDVTLTGNNVFSRDPIAPFPFHAETGAYKPYGTPAQPGEVVKGQVFCSTGVLRARPDGSDPELIAWGIRNPYGMAFGADGALYVSDNDMEEKGSRAVAEDPDRVWLVKNARRPYGSVTTPDWYGFPDVCADGLPPWHESHLPNRGQPAKPLLQDPPPWAGPPVYRDAPHTGLGKLDVCRSDAFGHRGELFLCRFGTYAPLNTIRPEALNRGFDVVRIDAATGRSEPFLRNLRRGPASAHPGSGGLERPVDCKFGPDGRTFYVLDFGVNTTTKTHVVAYAFTGVVWRVTRT
ncbi:MAG TPA: hypothetical protein VF590_09140 [Isosphaeraceae bacterium]|jgi:hypothetical protein